MTTASDSSIDLTAMGRRLRAVRQRRGWTRADVQRLSEGRWTTTALGTYERGERVMSAVAVLAIANFYGVPVAYLIEGTVGAEHGLPNQLQRGGLAGFAIDTMRLAESGGWPRVERFIDGVRQVRVGPSGRVIRLRRRDVPYIAAVHNSSPDRFVDQLMAQGVLIMRSAEQIRPEEPSIG